MTCVTSGSSPRIWNSTGCPSGPVTPAIVASRGQNVTGRSSTCASTFRHGSALSTGRSMNASTTCARSDASVLTATARMTPDEDGEGTESAIASSARSTTAAPTCLARAKRVMFSSCTASMLQPQMLSCGWFCSSVFQAWRSWPAGYVNDRERCEGGGCGGATRDAIIDSGSAYDSSRVWTCALCCFR